jgi:hypothetical protein
MKITTISCSECKKMVHAYGWTAKKLAESERWVTAGRGKRLCRECQKKNGDGTGLFVELVPQKLKEEGEDE